MRFGVPASGPMDRRAHAAANLAIGNRPDATAIEVALGGLTIECHEGAVTVAMTGGDVVVDHDGERLTGWVAVTLRAGQRLAVRAGRWGSWSYVAVAGTLDVPQWLGSTATHSLSGFGGGAVRSGDDVLIADAEIRADREGDIPLPDGGRPSGSVSVVAGPQDHHFNGDALDTLCTKAYRLSDAYDRMGVRLEGPALGLRDVLSIPSEPIVRGSIQVAGDGVPTVLFADHQTTGGYPKIATVISSDIDDIAQLRSGDEARFEPVTADRSVELVRTARARDAAYLELVARPGRTLAHRLRQSNIIGGVRSIDDHDE